jgi:outer membrane biosynthesis protein TonB
MVLMGALAASLLVTTSRAQADPATPGSMSDDVEVIRLDTSNGDLKVTTLTLTDASAAALYEQRAERDPNIEVEPVVSRRFFDLSPRSAPRTNREVRTQVAPAIPQNWNQHALWAGVTGDTGVGTTVAILDAGIVPGIDPDVDRQVVGRVSYDASRSPSPYLHGTAVADVVTQIAPGARLLDVRVGSEQAIWSDQVVNGIVWAVNNGANVINMSFGGLAPSIAEQIAIDWAIGRGVSVVAASGNKTRGTVDRLIYPGRYANVYAVGSFNEIQQVSAFSVGGFHVASYAPGEQVPVFVDTNFEELVDGTSFASPHIAALVALTKQNRPTWTPAQIEANLRIESVPLSGGFTDPSSGRTPTYPTVGSTRPLDAVSSSVAFDTVARQAVITVQRRGNLSVPSRVVCDGRCPTSGASVSGVPSGTTSAEYRLPMLGVTGLDSAVRLEVLDPTLPTGKFLAEAVLVRPYLAPPTAPALASVNNYPGGLQIGATSVSGAVGYLLQFDDGARETVPVHAPFGITNFAVAVNFPRSAVGRSVSLVAIDELSQQSLSSPSVIVQAPAQILGTPTGTRVVAATPDFVTLAWDRVPEATSYSLTEDSRMGRQWTVSGTTATLLRDSNFIDTGDAKNFAIAAVASNGAISSAFAQFPTVFPLPDVQPPTQITASALPAGVQLAWRVGVGATAYYIERNGVLVAYTDSSAWLDAQGRNGDRYTLISIWEDPTDPNYEYYSVRSAPITATSSSVGPPPPAPAPPSPAPTPSPAPSPSPSPTPPAAPPAPPAAPPAPPSPPAPSPPPAPVAPPLATAQDTNGYRMVTKDGRVFAFGGATVLPANGTHAQGFAVDIASAKDGYWVLTSNGNIRAFGSAAVMANVPLAKGETAVAIEANSDGTGAWVVTSKGRIHARGAATTLGDLGGKGQQIVSLSATASGQGYFMTTRKGVVRAFGDAKAVGDLAGKKLAKPIVAVTADPDGSGYWLTGADGAIFTFDSVFAGAASGQRLNRPVVGHLAGGTGYLMITSDGGVISFGAMFYGSLGASPPNSPVVAIAKS